MAPNVRNGNPIESTDGGLDAIDRRILRILQRDSLISNQVLADEIGLSPPACLKRVRRLRTRGVIERTVAVLSPAAVGYPLLTVARVKLDRPTEESLAAFEARMAALPRVTTHLAALFEALQGAEAPSHCRPAAAHLGKNIQLPAEDMLICLM